MTTARRLSVPLRTFEPRCTRSPLRDAALVLSTPLVIACIGAVEIWIAQQSVTSWGVFAVAAAVIFAAWLWTFSRHGPIRGAQLALLTRRVARRPAEPWLGDHRWDPEGAGPSPSGSRSAAGCLWICVTWIGLALLAVRTAAGLTVILAGVTTWAAMAWHRSGRGRGRVAFVAFPYFADAPVELHFGMRGGGATFLRARYVLRRIQEVDGTWWRGGPRRTATFAAECVLADGVLPGPDADVRLRFDVPRDAGGTRLSGRWPSYWELAVVGETTHGPYCESFLVPIYERPAAPLPA
jgi:hypothetical protein